MILRGIGNIWRLAELERFVVGGAIVYAHDHGGLLTSDEEIAHVEDLLKLKMLGLLGRSLPQDSESILAQLPPSLASYIRAKYPPAAVVGFAIEHASTPAEIREVFIQDAVENSHGVGAKKGRRRDNKGRLIAKPLSEQGPAAIGARRKKRILEAHRALRECNGDETAAAGKLNLPLRTFRRHIRWTPPDDIAGEVRRIAGKTSEPRKSVRSRPATRDDAETRSSEQAESNGFAQLGALVDRLKNT